MIAWLEEITRPRDQLLQGLERWDSMLVESPIGNAG